ncbi:hypothetical protein BDK51DRAFT_26666 [Blyttiomyces helicus]|uniref:Uncharacterized protein n=1 Tax=Blyttiomyces helicus TaxID=388810 RepID=A0A4P9WMN9_9FUNG|nr:hypothetical protein BDK51DRAFT_26666 [Blyttiomyces helicus]|eukprot:RKO92006.1 hypothetical protein BDK51DRAFT_26666 [Blyttiomyces helicus]
MAFIDKPFAPLQKKIEEFRIAFMQSRLEIPTEEPPVLLRLFAKRETLAMLYHNIKTGCTIFPQLRPGPDVQQKEIMASFWTLFSEATKSAADGSDVAAIQRSEGVHKLYILLATESVSSESIPSIAMDILRNARALSAHGLAEVLDGADDHTRDVFETGTRRADTGGLDLGLAEWRAQMPSGAGTVRSKRSS